MQAALDNQITGVCLCCEEPFSYPRQAGARRRYCFSESCNRERRRAARNAWASRNPDAHRRLQRGTHLRQRFGISLAQYEEMLAAQGGVCAVCGCEPSDERWGVLAVDHCHETGAIRALCCLGCNTGMGNFRDDPERLRKAAAYLDAHRATGAPASTAIT